YPESFPEFVTDQTFLDGFFGDKRPLAATEIVSLSFNLKKKIMEKTISIAFSQVTQIKDVRKFLMSSQKTSDEQIELISKILKADKLMLYHIGMLLETAQAYHGTGLATAMR